MVVATAAAETRTEIGGEIGMAAEAVRERTPSAADSDDRATVAHSAGSARGRPGSSSTRRRRNSRASSSSTSASGDRPSTSPMSSASEPALGEVERLREALTESPFVLDLTGEGETALARMQARRAQLADAVLAGSSWELAELRGRLRTAGARARRPTAPRPRADTLPRRRSRRPRGAVATYAASGVSTDLAGPMVLFAGPYAEAGGLDLLLEVVFRLAREMPELRIAAIPHGRPTAATGTAGDARPRSGAPRHRRVGPSRRRDSVLVCDRAVVCRPAREPGSGEPAKRAAAADAPSSGVTSSRSASISTTVGRDTWSRSVISTPSSRRWRRSSATRRGCAAGGGGSTEGRSRVLARCRGEAAQTGVGAPARGRLGSTSGVGASLRTPTRRMRSRAAVGSGPSN